MNRQKRGRLGEDAAATFLEKRGFRVLARNWRCGPHELDVICMDADTLVFVEVRTRAVRGMVSPAESLTPTKRRNLMKAARDYLAENGLWAVPCRFDLVCVRAAGATLELEHIPDVLEFSETLDSGDASWQPW